MTATLNTHCINGPSVLERRDKCPRSRIIEEKVWHLPDVNSDDATEGQLLHRAVSDPSLDASLSNEQRIAVDRIRATISHWSELKPVKSIAYEVKLATKHPYGLSDYDYDGTVDCIIIYEDNTCVILDFKFGRIKVDDAYSNLQVFAYALAAHDTFGVKEVTIQILQPRVFEGISEPYTCSDFDAIRENISTIIRKGLCPGAPTVTGDHCKYCRGNTFEVCDAYKKNATLLIKQDTVGFLPVAEWSDDQLSEFHDKFNLLKNYSEKQVVVELKKRIEAKGSCGGYTLANRKGVREAKDIEQVFAFCEDNGIDKEAFLSLCTISIGDIENALIEIRKEKAKALGEKRKVKEIQEEVKLELEPFIDSKPDTKYLKKS